MQISITQCGAVADGVTNNAKHIQAAINETIATGEGKTVICKTVGTNEKGEVVAEFNFTWSFKAKK
jgi:hypothetical protein